MLCEYRALQTGTQMGSAYIEGASLEAFLKTKIDQLTGPSVIKAHHIGQHAMSILRSGQVKAVCTIRDPRDCVASDLQFLHKDINFSIRRVSENFQFTRLYEGNPFTLFVRYEQMMANPVKEIARIAGHMGIDADETVFRQIDIACNLENSKAAIGALMKMKANEVIWLDNHRVDPGTHLHENHIHDARSGKWRDSFSVYQAERLTEIFKPWLFKFGYEFSDTSSTASQQQQASAAALD